LPLAAGLAVRDAVAEVAGDEGVQLKWPNDLLYRGRKLAGLLCERLDQVDLVGLGVNVNVPPRVPKGLRDRVVFLEEVAGRTLDLSDTLAAIARRLRGMVRNADAPFATVLRAYDRHHALVGRRVKVVTGNGPAIVGRCAGLDETGRLLVRGAGKKVHRVIAGHVELE
jgi:BirA family biotin operon repressor/biotin-[acetyl-CoA-carboxylase] ligase